MWAIGTQAYPPFVQDNPKLLGKIREVRRQAAATIQTIVKEEFLKQPAKLNAESEAILNTVENIWNGKKQSASLADRMDRIGPCVGHVISALENKLQKRRKRQALKQLSNVDWDRFCVAFHCTKTPPNPNKNAFTVTQADRHQIDEDICREITQALQDDLDDGDSHPPTPSSTQPKRKRNPSRLLTPQNYRIPKKSTREAGALHAPTTSLPPGMTTDTASILTAPTAPPSRILGGPVPPPPTGLPTTRTKTDHNAQPRRDGIPQEATPLTRPPAQVEPTSNKTGTNSASRYGTWAND